MLLKTEGGMDFWVLKTAGMFRLSWVLILSSFIFSCNKNTSEKLELPFYNEPSFSPIFIENADCVDKKINHKIADFAYLDQDSSIFSSEKLKGKIHVSNFIFTSCGSICPTMTKNIKLVNDEFQKDDKVVILSFSVTPWIDTSEKLNKYKSENKISNPNWHFLTGKTSEIYSLARKSYFAEEDFGFTKDSTEFLHTEHVLLVDKSKRIRGIYNGTLQLEMQQLIEDIKILKKEQ